MDEVDKEKLRVNQGKIVHNMLVDGMFLDYMQQTNLLTEEMCQDIEAIPEKQTIKRARYVAVNLPFRGPFAFGKFIECLMECGQEYLADIVDKVLADEWRKKEADEKALAKKSSPLSPPQASSSHRLFVDNRVNHPQIDYNTPLISVAVRHSDFTDADIRRRLSDLTNSYYPMSRNPRGLAIIINNQHFTVRQLPDRDGGSYDNVNICQLFDALSFKTEVLPELTGTKIVTELAKVAKRAEHATANAFVCFLMSHGTRGKIYGTDGVEVDIEEDIIKPFRGLNCPSLIGKPKLFFIQACQGSMTTRGVRPDGSGETKLGNHETDAKPVGGGDASSMPLVSTAAMGSEASGMGDAMSQLSLTDDAAQLTEHEMSDILAAYSTVPDYMYKSFRDIYTGSWFVRAIVKVLCEESYCEDLLSLLTKVRNEVEALATKEQIYGTARHQLTCTKDTLQRFFFFNPGYQEDIATVDSNATSATIASSNSATATITTAASGNNGANVTNTRGRIMQCSS